MFFFNEKVSRVGVGIGRDGLHAVQYKWNSGWQVEWSNSEALPFLLFGHNIPNDLDRERFVQAIKNVSAEAIRKNKMACVTIPDPAICFSIYSLKSVPQKHTDQFRLCQAHFAKQGGIDINSMALTFQELGKKEGSHSMLGLGMEKRWFDWLQTAFMESGLRVAGFTAHSCGQFNRFYDQLVSDNCVAAMIVINEESWSLFIWDENGCLQFCRALWRHKSGGAGELQSVLEDIERVSRSYTRGEASKVIHKFYVVGNSSEARVLFDLLQLRIGEKNIMESIEGDHALQHHLCYLDCGDTDLAASAAALGVSA